MAKRIVDHVAVRSTLLRFNWCAACSRPAGGAHHVIPRSEGGDDVPGNIVGLCGSGTSDCHGAWHGNPYVILGMRRDAEWVRRRVGHELRERRRDVLAYVCEKLGDDAGLDYLCRIYYINEVP